MCFASIEVAAACVCMVNVDLLLRFAFEFAIAHARRLPCRPSFSGVPAAHLRIGPAWFRGHSRIDIALRYRRWRFRCY